ncbi:MAG: Asp/Glu racemase [Chloroflexota bacterium]
MEKILSWSHVPSTLDDGPAAKASIGLIALASDIVIEPELRVFLPKEDVALYTNRIPMSKAVTIDSLKEMSESVIDVAEGLIPEDHLDVVIYGCTSGSITIGPETIAAKVRLAKPDIPVTDPISAGLKGLRSLGCQRIAVLTPYIDEVNQLVEAYIRGQGFDLMALGSFKRTTDPEVCRIRPRDIYDAGAMLGKSAQIEGIFLSCTALRTSSIIQALEDELGVPVVSSNQALAWDALRLAGYAEPIDGFGRLLTA